VVGAWDRVSDFPGIEPPDVPRFPILVSEPLKLIPRDRRPEVEAIQRSIARLPFDSFPFWLATTSSHTHSWDPDAPPNDEWYNPQRKRGRVVISDPDAAEHVHLLIGGISFYRVREILAAWPGRKKGPRAVYRVWNLLHYMLSQEEKDLHSRDAGRCQNLTQPPIESWNLEAVRLGFNYRMRIKRRRENRGRKRRKTS
jgi:hypothetical protein